MTAVRIALSCLALSLTACKHGAASTDSVATTGSTTLPEDGGARADSPTASAPRTAAPPVSADSHGNAAESGREISLDAADSVSIVDAKPSPQDSDLMVLIRNQAMTCDSLCANAAHNVEHALLHQLMLNVTSVGALVPGSYPITERPPPSDHARASAFFAVADADCHVHTTESKAGTIVVKAITSEKVSGTYNVSLASGDHMSGSFAAPRCDRFSKVKRSLDAGAKTCVR